MIGGLPDPGTPSPQNRFQQVCPQPADFRSLVEAGERQIARKRAEIGMVFQQFNLFSNKTVLGNLMEA
ncbi:MAG TPA: hypothetical protein VKV38_02305, partial [Trebonia sp.]|nr:hypothetical protein [Trebonia sp.]